MKKSTINFIALSLLGISINAENVTTNIQTQVSETKEKTSVFTDIQRKGLNVYFSSDSKNAKKNAQTTLKIKSTGAIAQKILNKIEELEKTKLIKTEIYKNIKSDSQNLLKAAKPLFDILKNFKTYLPDLAEKILSSNPEIKDPKNSTCLQYIDLTEKEAQNFFEQGDTTQIQNLCLELKMFSDTVIANLNQEILDQAEELARQKQASKTAPKGA